MDYGTKLKVADLFAGAGGFSLGAIDAGCDVVFAVEFNPNAALTYKNNIGKPPRAENVVVYNDDITKLDPVVLARKHFPEAECDLLLGGAAVPRLFAPSHQERWRRGSSQRPYP